MKKTFMITILCLLLIANVSALNIDDVEITPSTVEPGNRATIEIKVENNYEKTIENIIDSAQQKYQFLQQDLAQKQ
jgi:hypothetical protein